MKVHWRVRIWMVEVRTKGSSERWSVTGPDWFHTREECKKYIATEILKDNFNVYEYRATKYAPAEDR